MLLPRASLAVIYVPLMVVTVSGVLAGAAASGRQDAGSAVETPVGLSETASQWCAGQIEPPASSPAAGQAHCASPAVHDGTAGGTDHPRLARAAAGR